ncbi:MAG TPA: M20/M25/M40 family metallo-hydrolase, partial [Ktedonobacterales bacterium]|nr:M20/M25/M40 family metallo-hydrolase [Ktedonobacterales bacterium]
MEHDDNLKSEIAARRPEMVALRRHFHQHPETAFEERETAREIARRLRESGLEVTEGVGKTGVVGLLRGAGDTNGQGKTLLVRADIDALPVTEANDSPYISQTPGKMHACGHDGHITIALTLADLLARRRDQLAGNVKFAFQPAEELAAGAQPMLDD